MFNFNTNIKRKNVPDNSYQNDMNYGKGYSKAQNEPDDKVGENNMSENDFVESRIDEIEKQRIEFMQKNPNFDMKEEMQNPDFVNYVWKNGLSVEDAFFLAHKEEIIEAEVKNAMRKISARRGRIVENGTGKGGPAVVKKNPKDMSDKEIDSIIDRVRNGEKISF